MLLRILLLSGCSILISTSASFADSTIDKDGNPITIGETQTGSFTSTVTITGADFNHGEIIRSVRFGFKNVHHTSIGDLVFTIEAPDGQIATLMHRPGRTGGAGPGDDSNLGASAGVGADYFFEDQTPANSIWTEAANGNTNFYLASGTYSASGEDNVSVSLADFFVGSGSPLGIWTFTVSDFNDGNGGTFGASNLRITTSVPEPGLGSAIGYLVAMTWFVRRRKR